MTSSNPLLFRFVGLLVGNIKFTVFTRFRELKRSWREPEKGTKVTWRLVSLWTLLTVLTRSWIRPNTHSSVCGSSPVTEGQHQDVCVSCRESQGMRTNSPMKVKRREGAKATLKPVSLLLPEFSTHAIFLRNREDVMLWPVSFSGVPLWLFIIKNSCHLGKRPHQNTVLLCTGTTSKRLICVHFHVTYFSCKSFS